MPTDVDSVCFHHHYQLLLSIYCLLLLFEGSVVEGDTPRLQRDKQVLLTLKSYLELNNQVNRGRYIQWNHTLNSSPCDWSGITCSSISDVGLRVTAIDLSDSSISGRIFSNFSALTELTYLDLSHNTLGGQIPSDLSNCKKLKHLNLSHNIIDGELKLTGLTNLEVIDLTLNRISGGIRYSFPAICESLKIVNISSNKFSGEITGCFDQCWRLEHVDLSSNNFTGKLWDGFARVKEFSVSENKFHGSISPSYFSGNCNLVILDLSENDLYGEIASEISNCGSLTVLNLWGNHLNGLIPWSLGSVSTLEALILGKNNFSRNVPRSLLNCSMLTFLDLSRNKLDGDIPEIFGEFNQLKFLVLHSNSFSGGIYSSGIMKLPNISRLDLSYNNFSGDLPVEISEMRSLQYLVLAYNKFSGAIPPEYGNLKELQALDLSFNKLSGRIPSSFGNFTSLLWLMLANNSLRGEIPPELGNCSSLLWLNMANNQLEGKIPIELTRIGVNPTPTFLFNRQSIDRVLPGSGECLVMKRWIFANYPPFSFVYTLLTRKSCRSIWNRILKGYALFPVCVHGSSRTFQVSGYLQLMGNRLTGEIPKQIGRMHNFSMIHLGDNHFSGGLPSSIADLPLVVLNVSNNGFLGRIPTEIGNIKCLQNLDLSYNNFSGEFPTSLNNLNELSKFNISYNPLIYGEIPNTGQLATFEKYSYLGNPMLNLPSFISNSKQNHKHNKGSRIKNHNVNGRNLSPLGLFMIFLLTFLIFGAVSLLIITTIRRRVGGDVRGQRYVVRNNDNYPQTSSSSSWSGMESEKVKVIWLDNMNMTFTYAEILKATNNFSNETIIGVGGYATVYKATLSDGRKVAVKRLQSEGIEGEREFRAEMEMMVSGCNDSVWPHPNLVTLYGWCLYGSQKILIYEYMEGGSLEDLIPDRKGLTWKHRMQIAIDVARALVFLHHECYPPIIHRDVKASNVLLDKDGNARVTDFGLARVVESGNNHVSTIVAGTIGYVAPEYSQTWQATTKGDVYSYGVLAMELATGRKAVDVAEEECLVEWARRKSRDERLGLEGMIFVISDSGSGEYEMRELLEIGIKCTTEAPQGRPSMKEVLALLVKIVSSIGQKDVAINCESYDCIH